MDAETARRYVILAEGLFGTYGSKTAMGVIAYGHSEVLAVLDSSQAGRNVSEWLGPDHDIPVVATLDEALAAKPNALLVGVATQGGNIPAGWRVMILHAIERGMDIVNGLHEFISEDPEFSAAAAAHGVQLIDHRRPPERRGTVSGRAHRPGSRVVLTVGTDCAIGKMTVALELRKAALAAGLSSAFVPTGQTGIMIDGWGVSVDAVVADFLQSTAEWLVEQAEEMGDWVFVEGQGSIDHPSYSSVTLGLIHGTTPHAMVLVHQPGRSRHAGWKGPDPYAASIKPIADNIRLYEMIAAAIVPAPVVAISLNTSEMSDDEARAEIVQVAEATGLPTDDPVRFGPERLFAGVRAALERPRT